MTRRAGACANLIAPEQRAHDEPATPPINGTVSERKLGAEARVLVTKFYQPFPKI